MNNDFRNYAVKHLGMNGLALDQYIAAKCCQCDFKLYFSYDHRRATA